MEVAWHRFFRGNALGDSSFSLDWDSTYVNYWREDGIGGHRIDLYPSISAPIPISPYLETLAEFSLRDTFYYVETYGDAEWDRDDTQNRFIPEYKIEVATTLERDFLTGDGELDGFTHQIRPFVKYGHIPGIDQTKYPQFDAVDLINVKNAVTYGMDNFFNSLASKDLFKSAIWDTASLRVEQSYDLRQDPSDQPFSEIFTKLGWAPTNQARITYRTSYDVYDNDFSTHNFGGVYRNSRGDLFGLDYSFKQAGSQTSTEIEQVNAIVRAPIISSWIAGAEIQHSLSQEETIKANGSLTYMAPCWSVTFEAQHTPVDTAFVVLFNLANIGIPIGAGI